LPALERALVPTVERQPQKHQNAVGDVLVPVRDDASRSATGQRRSM